VTAPFKRYAAERAKRRLPPDLPTNRKLSSTFRLVADALDADDEARARRLMAYLAAEGFAFLAAIQAKVD
jgi:hypothetical protein